MEFDTRRLPIRPSESMEVPELLKIALTGEALELGQSGASPAIYARLAACPGNRLTGASPVASDPFAFEAGVGKVCYFSRDASRSRASLGFKPSRCPSGYMTPAPQSQFN